jgi:hypothetical protein
VAGGRSCPRWRTLQLTRNTRTCRGVSSVAAASLSTSARVAWRTELVIDAPSHETRIAFCAHVNDCRFPRGAGAGPGGDQGSRHFPPQSKSISGEPNVSAAMSRSDANGQSRGNMTVVRCAQKVAPVLSRCASQIPRSPNRSNPGLFLCRGSPIVRLASRFPQRRWPCKDKSMNEWRCRRHQLPKKRQPPFCR